MKKRLVTKLFQERIQGLRSHDGYFFREGYEHILRGVLLDWVPRGVYVYDFRFPLFDPAGPNLLYSKRTPGTGFIAKGEVTEAELVDHVFKTPELSKALVADEPMSLREFLDYLTLLSNEHVHLVRAAALSLLGDDCASAAVLDANGHRLHPSDVESCRRLRAALVQGRAAVVEYLAEVRAKNLRAFGVRSRLTGFKTGSTP